MYFRNRFYWVFWALCCPLVSIVSAKPIEQPFIRHISNQQIGISSTARDIEYFDNKIYIATSGELLSYDGTTWSRIESLSEVNTLCNYANRLWFAGNKILGYIEKNEIHQVNIDKFLREGNAFGTEIWKLQVDDNCLYARVLNGVLVLKYCHDIVQEVRLLSNYSSTCIVNDSVFATTENQLVKYNYGENQELTDINFGDQIILGYAVNSKIYVITARGRYIIYDPDTNTVSDCGSLLKKQYTAIEYNKSSEELIIGTIDDGVYIYDSKLKFKYKINKQNGLSSNNVNALTIDKLGNLWLLSRQGVDFIDFNNPIRCNNENNDNLGTVSTIIDHKGNLYIGTDHGVYYAKQNPSLDKFNLIDGSDGQVWNLRELDGHLYCFHVRGLYEIIHDKLLPIYTQTGCWDMIKHPSDDDVFILGTFSGIRVLKRKNGILKEANFNGDFTYSSRFISFDNVNQLWIAHPGNGFFKIKIDLKKRIIEMAQFYPCRGARLTQIDNNIIFYGEDKTFIYDNLKDSLIPSIYYENIIQQERGRNVLYIKQFGQNFIYSNSRTIGLMHRNINQFTNYRVAFAELQSKLPINDMQAVHMVDSTIYIGLNEGYAIVELERILQDSTLDNARPQFSIQAIYNDFTYKVRKNKKNIFIVNPRYDEIVIQFLIALDNRFYGDLYEVVVDSGLYSSSIINNRFSLPRFSSGMHNIKIQDISSKSELETIKIYVRRPLSIRWYMILLYMMVVTIGIGVFIKYRREDRRKKFLLLQYEKDRELFSLDITCKQDYREIFSRIITDEIVSSISKKFEQFEVKVLSHNGEKISSVEELLNKELDDFILPDFALYFIKNDLVDFLNQLRLLSRELTSNDYRLSLYIKMGLSTKDISDRMNISPKSVDMARYRLRKKLNLDRSKNLHDFLCKL